MVRGELGTKTVFENDVNLAALGERWHGLGKDVDHFVYLHLGTGVGLGIVVGGELYRGSGGAAGEVGYLPLWGTDLRDPESRRRGPLDRAASADGVVRAARTRGAAGIAHGRAGVRRGGRRAMRARERVVRAEAERIALTVAAVAAVLDPGLVILGGGIGANGELLLAPVRERLAEVSPFRPRVEASACARRRRCTARCRWRSPPHTSSCSTGGRRRRDASRRPHAADPRITQAGHDRGAPPRRRSRHETMDDARSRRSAWLAAACSGRTTPGLGPGPDGEPERVARTRHARSSRASGPPSASVTSGRSRSRPASKSTYAWITVDAKCGVTEEQQIAAINAGNPPDVFLSFGVDNVGRFCESGAWADLNPYIDDAERGDRPAATFPEAALTYTSFDGVQCSLPFLTDAYGIYYNLDHLRGRRALGTADHHGRAHRVRQGAHAPSRRRLDRGRRVRARAPTTTAAAATS